MSATDVKGTTDQRVAIENPVTASAVIPDLTAKKSFDVADKKKLTEQWEAVLREYTRAKYSIDDAYHQARLARILREGEYNYTTNKPKLWDYKYEYYRHFKEDRKVS